MGGGAASFSKNARTRISPPPSYRTHSNFAPPLKVRALESPPPANHIIMYRMALSKDTIL